MGVHREVRWAFANYLLLNAYCFVVGAVQGAVLLASSTDGSIPGWSGSPPEQVFWYAATVVFFTSLFFGIPVLAVALTLWRLAIRVVGHPRLTAFGLAGAMVLIAAIRIDRTEPFYVGVVPAIVLGYAAIVRLPPVQAGAVSSSDARSRASSIESSAMTGTSSPARRS